MPSVSTTERRIDWMSSLRMTFDQGGGQAAGGV